jgi:hypothetical protein
MKPFKPAASNIALALTLIALQPAIAADPAAGSARSAAAGPEADSAFAPFPVYRLNPSPANKAEVKAALEALDDEIDRLEDYAEDLPKGTERSALEKRIKALDKRESALKRDFTKARWDSLVADLKTEWNQLAD